MGKQINYWMEYESFLPVPEVAIEQGCVIFAKKVCSEECDIDLAEIILQSVLHDNAKRVFKF